MAWVSVKQYVTKDVILDNAINLDSVVRFVNSKPRPSICFMDGNSIDVDEPYEDLIAVINSLKGE